jgi:hypothetical protein
MFRTLAVTLAALLGLTVTAGSAAAAAEPVTNRTVYASKDGALVRLTLDAGGTIRARTAVASGSDGHATDTAAGRTLFVRPTAPRQEPEIWLRDISGASRLLTTGSGAIFTPGRTAVLFSRQAVDLPVEGPETRHSELFLYRLADGRTTPLFTHGSQDITSKLRYSPDGRSIWMLVQVYQEPSFNLVRYGIAEHKILRNYGPLGGEYGCDEFELLPSGTRAVLICEDHKLWTVRLDTGAVTYRKTVVSANTYLTRLDGRLSAATLLISGYTSAPSGGVTHWLGALDLRTFTVRRLAGSTGHGYGITAY